MQIMTERLLLRAWEDADAEQLYLYAKDPRVGPVAGWPPHTDADDSLRIIRTVLSDPETYAVVLRKTGKPVGCASIMLPGHGTADMEQTEAEIGYWLGVPFWGQGLIPEAVRALLRRCFWELGRDKVWCGYYDGNDKSRRVQEKCGFEPHHARTLTSPMGDERLEHFTLLTKEKWWQSEQSDYRPGRYRHFKGLEYELLYMAKHSETLEDMVVYRALYGAGGVWTRPAKMWNEYVERDGRRCKRFTRVWDEP